MLAGNQLQHPLIHMFKHRQALVTPVQYISQSRPSRDLNLTYSILCHVSSTQSHRKGLRDLRVPELRTVPLLVKIAGGFSFHDPGHGQQVDPSVHSECQHDISVLTGLEGVQYQVLLLLLLYSALRLYITGPRVGK